MDRPSEIGSSLVIKGELTAGENIVISGRLEGSVVVEGHVVTIAAGANVSADVEAREIVVSGEVHGTMTAGERIDLRETAKVHGEAEAPVMRMADGARFQGKAETTKAGKAGLKIAS